MAQTSSPGPSRLSDRVGAIDAISMQVPRRILLSTEHRNRLPQLLQRAADNRRYAALTRAASVRASTRFSALNGATREGCAC